MSETLGFGARRIQEVRNVDRQNSRLQRFVEIFWFLAIASFVGRLIALRIAGYAALESWREQQGLSKIKGEASVLTETEVLFQWLGEQSFVVARGLAHDFIFAAIGAIILCFFSKALVRILGVIFVGFLAANVEHIKYNYGHIEPSMLGMGLDPTFVRGSFTTDLLKYFLFIGATAGLVSLSLKHQLVRQAGGVAVPIAVCFVAIFGVRSNSAAPDWLQTHPLVPINVASDLPLDFSKPDDAALSWSNLPPPLPGRYNLMVVYLEGLSIASLTRGDMKTLKQLGEDGVRFENYISRQIITANGLYASLTSDTPSFLRKFPKWVELDESSTVLRQSLPSELSRSGYLTNYLQSAQLAYMNKDSRLPLLGFDIVKGDGDWQTAHGRNGWGVDDLTLVERTLEFVDTLPSDKPWFVSMLTTGTHSPYNVPGIENPSRIDALQAADAAVATLISGLRGRGALENTVVIITSDEGRELTAGEGSLNDLAINRLPLIVLHPDLSHMSVPIYLHNTDLRDLALTLTHATDPQTFLDGLPQHKDVVFGNFIMGKVFWYDVDGQRLTVCRVSKFDCQVWPDRPELFEPNGPAKLEQRMPAFADLIKAHDRVPFLTSP